MAVVMSCAEMTDFIGAVFPQVADDFEVEAIEDMAATVRLKVQDKHLRPGGTVSGPTMFGLADFAAYIAILGQIGPAAMAVTTNCSIDFMRKPAADVDLRAQCRVLKLGKVLAVVDVLLYCEGMSAPVGRASLTYSLPPQR